MNKVAATIKLELKLNAREAKCLSKGSALKFTFQVN